MPAGGATRTATIGPAVLLVFAFAVLVGPPLAAAPTITVGSPTAGSALGGPVPVQLAFKSDGQNPVWLVEVYLNGRPAKWLAVDPPSHDGRAQVVCAARFDAPMACQIAARAVDTAGHCGWQVVAFTGQPGAAAAPLPIEGPTPPAPVAPTPPTPVTPTPTAPTVAPTPPAVQVPQPRSRLSALAATATTWPCFLRTPDHQPVVEAAGPEGRLRLRWTATVGPSLCSPCVVEKRIYCPSERGMSVVDLETGRVLATTPRGGCAFYWSSPCAVGDTVICGTRRGELLSLAADSLLVQRATTLGNAAEISSSPAVADGRVFIGSHDGSLYAADAQTLEVLWSFQTGAPVCSSPVLHQGNVIFGSSDGSVYAVRQTDGQPVWTFKADDRVDASPSVAGNTVYVGSFGGTFYALDAATGRPLGQQKLGQRWLHSSPVVYQGSIYVGSLDGTLYRLNANGLAVADQWQGRDAFYGTATVWGNWVMIGCRDNVFRGFARDDLAKGPVFQLRTMGKMHSNPVVVGDMVLMNCTDGRLRCYRLGGGPAVAPGGAAPAAAGGTAPAATGPAAVAGGGEGAAIVFDLAANAQVTVTIKNVAGHPIRTLIDPQERAAGQQRIVWDGKTDEGATAPNGRYIADINAQNAAGWKHHIARVITLER